MTVWEFLERYLFLLATWYVEKRKMSVYALIHLLDNADDNKILEIYQLICESVIDNL